LFYFKTVHHFPAVTICKTYDVSISGLKKTRNAFNATQIESMKHFFSFPLLMSESTNKKKAKKIAAKIANKKFSHEEMLNLLIYMLAESATDGPQERRCIPGLDR
jgi:hypothetical protein